MSTKPRKRPGARDSSDAETSDFEPHPRKRWSVYMGIRNLTGFFRRQIAEWRNAFGWGLTLLVLRGRK